MCLNPCPGNRERYTTSRLARVFSCFAGPRATKYLDILVEPTRAILRPEYPCSVPYMDRSNHCWARTAHAEPDTRGNRVLRWGSAPSAAT